MSVKSRVNPSLLVEHFEYVLSKINTTNVGMLAMITNTSIVPVIWFAMNARSAYQEITARQFICITDVQMNLEEEEELYFLVYFEPFSL